MRRRHSFVAWGRSHALGEAAAWIERHHGMWDARFDVLDTVVEELKRKENVDGRKARK
jgi:hypothetical protein